MRSSSGPASPVRPDYVLVALNETVVTRLSKIATASLIGLERRPPAQGEIGTGDMVGLTIFESDSGGLFLPREAGTRAGNFVTLPVQQVDRNGEISVPYAGKIRAAGLFPSVLQTRIEDRMAHRAVEPQVVVSIVDRRARPVNVLGEVAKAELFTLGPGGETILGGITRAGGTKFPSYESVVTLQRNDRVWRIFLSDIARDPKHNVQLMPDDVLIVTHEPRYFIAMGALGQGGGLGPVDRRIPFQDSKLTLSDAIARAGGLNDNLANSRAVFVYRFEPRATISQLDPRSTAAPFEVAAANDLPPIVPTIYLLDLNDPAGIFHASRFAVRGDDVVYVANAPATDLLKFLSLMTGATGSGASVRGTFR